MLRSDQVRLTAHNQGDATMSDNEPMIAVQCSCGQKMKAPASAMGKAYKCVRCGEKFQVTLKNATPIAVAAPPAPAPPAPPAPKPKPGRIGELLIDEGLVNQAQLDEALAVQATKGGKTFEILLALGHLDKEKLHMFLSKQPGVASLDLKNYAINRDLATLLPKEFALEHSLLPIDKMGRLLTVGMACPLDTPSIAEVERITGLKVKAMLCRLDDIRAAVRQYYPDDLGQEQTASLESFKLSATSPPSPKTEDASALVAQIEALPIMAASRAKLEPLLNGKSGALADLAAICREDPILTSIVLAIANSPAYGLVGKVNHIGVALTLLGFDGVRNVLRSAAQLENKKLEEAIVYEAFCEYVGFCAAAGQAIAATAAPDLAPAAFTAALLSDIGQLVLAYLQPERFAKIDHALQGAALLRAERSQMNLTHTDAGYHLAKKWQLPSEIAEAIHHHHSPEKAAAAKNIVAIAALASQMADAYQNTEGKDTSFLDSCGDVLKSLKLDKAAAERIYLQTCKARSSA